MKTLLKSITKSDWAHRQICRLIALYIWFVHATSRWKVEGTETRDEMFASGQPFLIALWHNRIGMMPYACKEMNHQLCVVASGHRDGRLVIDAMGQFGFDGIPVDSKNGSQATRAIMRRLKNGGWVGITPDGPRGPRLVVKEGMVAIAAMAGVPILPVAYSTNRRRTLNTWDRFHIPLPFGRGLCRWGEPITLPARPSSEQRETWRQHVEEVLNELTDGCDIAMGHKPSARAAQKVPRVQDAIK